MGRNPFYWTLWDHSLFTYSVWVSVMKGLVPSSLPEPAIFNAVLKDSSSVSIPNPDTSTLISPISVSTCHSISHSNLMYVFVFANKLYTNKMNQTKPRKCKQSDKTNNNISLVLFQVFHFIYFHNQHNGPMSYF